MAGPGRRNGAGRELARARADGAGGGVRVQRGERDDGRGRVGERQHGDAQRGDVDDGGAVRERAGVRRDEYQRDGGGRGVAQTDDGDEDRKSTRLNSSHSQISYAVFCLKKKIGDVVHVPPLEYSYSAPVVKAIVAAILAEPHKAVQLGSLDQIELPYRTLTELVLSIVRPLGYNIRGTNDILARTGGQSPYGNVGTWDTGLLLYDPTVNAGVGRFVAQPGGIQYLDDYYRPHGTLSIPLLTLHTTMDPDVPFFHEAALAKIVAAARTSKWLAQQSVQRYGHCNVTPAEVMLTPGRLATWAEHRAKPARADLTGPLA